MDPLPALLLLLVVAKIFGELVERTGFPSLIGEIGAGIFLGPGILGVVVPDETIATAADIGLILLLFASGLQLNQRSFLRSLKTGLPVAVCGVIVPFLGGVAAGYMAGYDTVMSLVIGITLSITSIGVSLRALVDIRQLKSDVGLVIVSAAVIDDVLGILLLGTLSALILGGGALHGSLLLVLSAILFIGLLLYPGRKWIPWLFSVSHRAKTHEMSYSVALIIGIACALLSNFAGLHYAIGAFLAGLILGDSIRSDRTLYDSLSDVAFGFFVTIFFASIGLLFPPGLTGFSLLSLAGLTALAMVTKTAGGFAGSFFALRDWKKSLLVGIGLCPRGEIALVVVSVSLAAGLISAALFSTLTLVVIATVLVSPLLMTRGFPGLLPEEGESVRKGT